MFLEKSRCMPSSIDNEDFISFKKKKDTTKRNPCPIDGKATCLILLDIIQ